MKILLFLMVGLLLNFSCIDQRANTSKFLFKENEAFKVRNAMVKFRNLSLKVFKFKNNKFKNNKVGYNVFELSFNEIIYLDGLKLGTRESIQNNPSKLFNLKELACLTFNEKKELFKLLKFLNNHFINGIVYNSKQEYICFDYCSHPFFGDNDDRFDKIIILKTDYNIVKNDFLKGSLITDKRDGMLLIMNQKEKYLRWVYESDEEVPKKWREPTEEVFRE